MERYRRVHRFEHLTRTHVHPAQDSGSAEQRSRIKQLTGRGAQQTHDSPRTDARDGTSSGTLSADVDHVIDAPASGKSTRLVLPFRMHAVVDRIVSAERAGLLQFLVARGGGDDACPRCTRELDGEGRNAARPQRQHRFAGHQWPEPEQRVPRGHACDRKRRAFCEIEVVGDGDEPVLVDGNHLREHSVEQTTALRLETVQWLSAADPALDESAGDAVADLPPGDGRPRFDDDARPVRPRNDVRTCDREPVVPGREQNVAEVDPGTPPAAFAHITLPAGDYATLRHHGSYDGLEASNQRAIDAVLASGRDPADFPLFHHFLDDPEEVAPEALRTDILIRLVPVESGPC